MMIFCSIDTQFVNDRQVCETEAKCVPGPCVRFRLYRIVADIIYNIYNVNRCRTILLYIFTYKLFIQVRRVKYFLADNVSFKVAFDLFLRCKSYTTIKVLFLCFYSIFDPWTSLSDFSIK